MSNKGIEIAPLVSKALRPLVTFRWGRNSGALNPEDARKHGMVIFEAAVSAEIDSALVKWGIKELNLSAQEAGTLLSDFRRHRATPQGLTCSMVIGEEKITPTEAMQAAFDLIAMAINTEMETFLAHYLVTQGADESQVNLSIEEMRRIRGLKTVDGGTAND